LKTRQRNRPSLRDFGGLCLVPGVETPGYFRLVSPRRNTGQTLNDQTSFAQTVHKFAVA
jgi:hypothetical protein